MIIIGDGIMLGAGGETASIVVTAPTGSTVTCTTPGGVVLPATEIGGTWTFAKLKVYGTYTITATNGTKTAMQDVLVDAVDVFSIEIRYPYSEQELLDMGVLISRTVGDQIKCNGRYIQRVETTPLAVCRVSYDTGYMGYAIISNAPVTESFIVSPYGAVGQIGGDSLTAYVYTMNSAWPTSNGYSVYLNNDVATYEFRTIGSAVADEYVETINLIANSLKYLM